MSNCNESKDLPKCYKCGSLGDKNYSITGDKTFLGVDEDGQKMYVNTPSSAVVNGPLIKENGVYKCQQCNHKTMVHAL